MRINKLLSNYGVCSRKEANDIIESGRVIINGVTGFPGQWVEKSDNIILDGKVLEPKEKIYIALNKPIGITCTAAKEVKNNIIDYMALENYIFPVGRLDKPSQGLILMTNDGDLANGILESENHHEKEYIVTVHKTIDNEFIMNMSKGVDIGETITRPCIVTKVNEDTFRIILTQGLNKQIRRMAKTFGYNVIKLERIRIMNINLEGIEYGKWRSLTKEELDTLKNLISN